MADRKVTVSGIKGRPVTIIIRGDNVRISRTAKFGPGVMLSDVKINAGCEIGAYSQIVHSSIDARTVIGERSKINQTNIGERVTIGSRAYCFRSTIGDRAVCGDRLHLSGVTVDDIVAGNDVEIQGRQMSESTIGSCTRIGDGTKIDFPWSSSIIGSAVAIGSRCKLSAGAIDDGVKMGDDVTLQYCRRILRLSRIESGVTMGAVYIGTKTVIGRGSAIGAILSDDVLIGNHVRVGENTIVRPGVMIPHNWEIPSNTIVNPHPDRPIIIPRTS